MNREAEEFRISSYIKQANLEIVQARLEQAEHCIREVAASLAWNCFGECRAVQDGPIMPAHGALEMARDFLASQQEEEKHSCKNCLGVDTESCMFKHPEQPEGFTHFPELLESVQQMDAMLKAEGSQGELLPCPFCGGQAHLTYDDYVHDDLRPMPVVECNACHTWVHAESWNKRAALAQPSPAVVQLSASRERRIYVAGPMTGYKDFNFPAFNAQAEALLGLGYHVENPAEHGIVDGAEWQDYLRYDIGRLSTCEAIFLLPGWSNSKGAALEVHIAKALGMTFIHHADAERMEDAPVVQAGEVPEGFALVPLEPTEQILDEFDSIVDYGAEDSRDAWRRLLAAAGDRHEA